MGKLLVLSVSDCEEHIFNRIMAAESLTVLLSRSLLPVSPSPILRFD